MKIPLSSIVIFGATLAVLFHLAMLSGVPRPTSPGSGYLGTAILQERAVNIVN